jgi:polar amino acid transport system substrate-binding protein
MKIRLIAALYAFVIQSIMISYVYAEEVIVYGLNAMPLCGLVEGKPTGIAVDILTEATNYGAPTFIFEMNVPWTRAQRLLQNTDGSLHAIIPFSRTPQREQNFKWIGELIKTQYHFYSYGRQGPVESLEEAKKILIGVVSSHAIIPLLEQAGISRLDKALDAEQNARKLFAKRFDTIAESDFIAKYNWQKIGRKPSEMLEGMNVGDITRVYIAAALHFPDDTANRIENALQKMRKDEKMQQIINKWIHDQ